MLVKTHQPRRPAPAWTGDQAGAREKTMVSAMQRGYEPVSTMSESTVVVYYNCDPIASSSSKNGRAKMRGARRVVTFCLLTACLPVMLLILPLYLRNTIFAERHYNLMEADIVPLTDGISSYFCQRHSLQALEGWFSAYQLRGEPKISSERRHATLERAMEIPDDRLEYWGFHLLPESTVTLAVCASSPGARLLVVRGEKNLELCGLLQHSTSPGVQATQPPIEVPAGDEESIFITFQEQPDEQEQPQQELDDENNGGEITDPPLTSSSPTPPSSSDIPSDAPFSDTSYPTSEPPEETTHHPIRHQRSKLRHLRDVTVPSKRPMFGQKSDIAHFEGVIEHGGNAANYTEDIDEEGDSSLSSFETDLLTCFSGKTLFQRSYAAGGKACETKDSSWTGSLRLKQNVRAQGHFYYVFYSDNDLEINSINARFHLNATKYDFTAADVYCKNVTDCAFDIGFMGGDGTVYVEANSDVLLVSTCQPRLAVYLMFPVCALLFVLIFGLL